MPKPPTPLTPSTVLPYLGAIPFVFCALLLLCGIATLPVLGSVLHMLNSYAVIIASFMAGSYWGIHLGPGGKRLAVVSNLLAIAIWCVFLFSPASLQLFYYAAIFTLLLWVDFRLQRNGLLAKIYWQTRKIVTTIVVFSLISAGIALSRY